MISALTLHKKIEESVISLSEFVVKGGCQTFDAYREIVGEIRAHRRVLEMLREKEKPSEGPASSHK